MCTGGGVDLDELSAMTIDKLQSFGIIYGALTGSDADDWACVGDRRSALSLLDTAQKIGSEYHISRVALR